MASSQATSAITIHLLDPALFLLLRVASGYNVQSNRAIPAVVHQQSEPVTWILSHESKRAPFGARGTSISLTGKAFDNLRVWVGYATLLLDHFQNGTDSFLVNLPLPFCTHSAPLFPAAFWFDGKL
jgi:hypothetical protein